MKRTTPWLALASLAAAGCSPSWVNLTAQKLPVNREGVYPFEVQWEDPRRGTDNPRVRAFVVIETNLYPMDRVGNTPNRWFGQAPTPANALAVPYQFKIVYDYAGLPKREVASSLSPQYTLLLQTHQ